MQLVSDVTVAALAVASSGDCNDALAVLTAFAAGQFVHRWWRRTSSRSPADAVPQASSQVRPFRDAERSDRLQAAIAQLPAAHQHVIRLRFIQRCTMHETALRTGLSCDEIKAVQYQALTALAAASSAERADPAGPAPPLDSASHTS